MSNVLRRKLVCFYCGCRSNQAKTPGLRKWQCTKCDAENWLDENGEITDPPTQASSSSQNARYVQPSTVSPIPILDPVSANASDEALFCATCVKNQHLHNESLANFYPSPTHDQFEGFEKAEQQFRDNLDARYPMICEQCEPRVRAKLKRVNYDAKADHILRVQDRLRGRRTGQSGWKGSIVVLGGLLWMLSWMVPICWHALGFVDAAALDDIKEFLQLSLDISKLSYLTPSSLEDMAERVHYLALWMALLSIWWHPRLGEKLIKPFGKLNGLSEYYKLQFVSLFARAVAWYSVTHIIYSDPETKLGIHLFMVVFSPLSAIILYRTVSTDYTPKVSFKESPEPLIKRSSIPPPNTNQQPPGQPSFSRGNAPIARPRPFSINDLAPRPGTSTTRLPTPPSEEDYDDPSAMDWAYTATPLSMSDPRLPPPFKPQAPHQNAPQSFRRPYNPPGTKLSYRATMAAKQASQFPTSTSTTRSKSITPPRSRTTGHPLDLFPLGAALENQISPTTDADFDDEDDNKSVYSDLSPQRNAFMGRRFYPQKNREETGLESIMEQAFRIGGVPIEVEREREEEMAMQQAEQEGKLVARAVASRAFWACLVIAFISCSWMLLSAAWHGKFNRVGEMMEGRVGVTVREWVKWFLDV